MMINWEYLCHGIEWVSTKEEQEAPYPFELEKVQRPGKPPIPRPWPERLSEQLISDLKAWNDSWGPYSYEDREVVRELQGRGRELAIRVQDELGTDEWEVLYKLDGRVDRVHPPGSWPPKHGNKSFLATRRRTRGRIRIPGASRGRARGSDWRSGSGSGSALPRPRSLRTVRAS
jgi:hypothetical protein